MPRMSRISLVFAVVLALVLTSRLASAQVTPVPTATTTTSTTTATVSATEQIAPDRILNFGTSSPQDLGPSTRPQNLNPLGISYNDCITDQTLQFNVEVSGFAEGQNLTVWATRSGDCSADTTRGASGAVAATCWLVNQGITGRTMVTPQSVTLTVRVQDLVGPQNAPPFPPVPVNEGASACLAQSTFVAVPMDIWFVPTFSNGLIGGTAYDYTIPGGTDLVGPPAPASVSIADGDTLFVVNWVANADTDTGGYDIFIDPIPGEPSDASSGLEEASTRLVCPEAAAPLVSSSTEASTSSDAETATDGEPSDAEPAGVGASGNVSDAQMSAIPTNDAGCYLVNVGGGTTGTSSGTGSCNSSVLTSGVVQDGGGVIVETEASTDLEAGDDATVVTEPTDEGNGGISTIPCQFGIGDLCGTTNLTVTGETDSTFTITGLTNGTTYTIVVAAVDNFGNIGPPSTEACDFPAPVNDFWKIYRTDGGGAGGSFCALEAVGAPAGSTVAFAGAGALVAMGLRRRRSKKR